jgi:hypothetical protein
MLAPLKRSEFVCDADPRRNNPNQSVPIGINLPEPADEYFDPLASMRFHGE